MKKRILLLCLAVTLVGAGMPAYAKKKKKGKPLPLPDFAKGITSHSDWVKRFRKTLEPRIFYLLASRTGRRISMQQSKMMCEIMKQDPAKVEEFLEQWGILLDVEKFLEEKQNDWKKKYGDEATITKTKNYIILATKVDHNIIRFLKFYQEKVFRFYQKHFSTPEKIEGRFLIYIYPDRAAYTATGAPGFSGAYYLASERKLVGYVEPEHRNNRKWIADTRMSYFFHEGFHQYFGYFVPNPPIWLNEGMAEMCAAITVRRKKLKEAGNMDYQGCKRTQAAITKKSYVPLKKFVRLSQPQYYSNPDLHYAQGWALVHFLRYGPKKYRSIINDIIFALKNGAERDEALDRAFYDIDWAKFEADWKKYIMKLKARKMSSIYILPKE